MTYLQFLLLFVVTPSFLFLALGFYQSKRLERGHRLLGWHWLGVGALAVIAFVWTTPWDNFIVANGVWTYGVDRVIAVVGYVPIEEYAFFVLMPIYNGAFFYCLLASLGGIRRGETSPDPRSRAMTFILGTTVLTGAFLLLRYEDGFFYLAATLLWFVPPLMLQWFFDSRCLVRNWQLIALGTGLPTLYLCVADYFAIQQGIWTISDPTRTGIDLLGLPLEEAVFFFIVSLLLAQGMTLWHRLKEA